MKIIDQGQVGSTGWIFGISKNLTSTSIPNDIQVSRKLQSKQKSTIKPDKPLTSILFGYQHNAHEKEIYISDSEVKELKLGNWLPPSVNQKVRKRDQNPAQYQYNRNNTYINSLNDNRDHQEMYWEQHNNNYGELKDEITEKLMNHTNKLIDNLENKFRQIIDNIERKQEKTFDIMFNRLEKTLNDINRQNSLGIENKNSENNIQNKRQTETQPQRNNSITNEERDTTVTEPQLPFYKQLKSVSINEEPQIEQNMSSGSVPATIRPFDGTDPAYTVEEYLNSIVAAMIFSSGIEPVNKPGHHQWKVKRAALILHTLQGSPQKWYSTLPSETKLDWEIFCKEFSDMFDSEKSKQHAKSLATITKRHK